MELETLFTEQRWNILKLLSKNKLSPLQMSESSNTTIANISQQLRLLEAAELVKKEKIKNRDKGKPRTLFSLTKDYAYLVTTMKDHARKKLVTLTDFNKFMLRVLFFENPNLHYYITKFYWKIEDHLENLDGILVSYSDTGIKFILIGEKSHEVKKKINLTSIKRPKHDSKQVSIETFSSLDLKKLSKENYLDSFHTIYDPKGEITKHKQDYKPLGEIR